eukprot:m.62089 g.62089  ORF g.62089 m.62089 type:complete len:261 (+) comp11483_c0_seq1:205-987(+)
MSGPASKRQCAGYLISNLPPMVLGGWTPQPKKNLSVCWKCVYRFMIKENVSEDHIKLAHLHNKLPKAFYLQHSGGTRNHEKCLSLDDQRSEQDQLKSRLNKARLSGHVQQSLNVVEGVTIVLRILANKYFNDHDWEKDGHDLSLPSMSPIQYIEVVTVRVAKDFLNAIKMEKDMFTRVCETTFPVPVSKESEVKVSVQEDADAYNFAFEIPFERKPTKMEEIMIMNKIKMLLVERMFKEQIEPPKEPDEFPPFSPSIFVH